MKEAMVVCLFLLLGAVAADGSPPPSRPWHLWKAMHQRSYKTEEDEHRATTYKENSGRIAAFNMKNLTYKLGENSFMDLSVEEFARRYLHRRPHSSLPSLGFQAGPLDVSALPDTVDWRTSGAVSPVEFQGVCGSCWTFTGVGAIESIIKIKKGVLKILSKQQIVDCADEDHGQAFKNDTGCDGGDEDSVPAYAHQYGICLARDYEYYGVKKFTDCSEDVVSSCSGGVSKGIVKGVIYATPYSETALLSALAQQPVAASIVSASFAFMFYDSGIFSECDFDNDTDHAVLIIGYGKDSSKSPYWLVKNSFGTMWGEDGYVRMSRSAGGKAGCAGILTIPSYPVLEDSDLIV